jgi:D-proline reductase (dithiol) PrdB
VSLAARHLEQAGIPTVVVGSARDIVEQCGVPRFLFTDFPLGNPCGAPYDVGMQMAIVGMALDLIEHASFPRTTVQTPYCWTDDAWRVNFMRFDNLAPETLRAMGEQRRTQQVGRHVTFKANPQRPG